MCEMITLELAQVSVEEPASPYLKNRGQQISVKPQPAHNWFEVCFTARANGRVELDLFDASGRRLCRLFEGTVSAGKEKIRFKLTDAQGRALAPGVYFLQLNGDRSSFSTKFVVTR